MKFNYNDGGREAAGFKGKTGDCVCRAIAIAAERPYKEVYDLINEYAKSERTGSRKRGKSNARTGVYKQTVRKVMAHYGFTWVPTMQIGQGCTVHLCEEELPKGRIVVSVSHHEVAVIDGVINDTYDPSRDEKRCVYGYYIKEERYKVAYEILAPSGRWLTDYIDNDGNGLTRLETAHAINELRHNCQFSIMNIRKEVK